jgi:hypothetical protein
MADLVARAWQKPAESDPTSSAADNRRAGEWQTDEYRR